MGNNELKFYSRQEIIKLKSLTTIPPPKKKESDFVPPFDVGQFNRLQHQFSTNERAFTKYDITRLMKVSILERM